MNLLTGRINNYLHSVIIVSSNGGSQTGFNCQKKKKNTYGTQNGNSYKFRFCCKKIIQHSNNIKVSKVSEPNIVSQQGVHISQVWIPIVITLNQGARPNREQESH